MEPIFRDVSAFEPRPMGFFLESGGIGDYICFLSGIRYVAKNYPYINGQIYSPDYFKPIVENVFQDFENWTVYRIDQKETTLVNGTLIKFPRIMPVNATMMHLLDLGFLYFAEVNPVPDHENYYCELDLDGLPLHRSVENLGGQYAVMTPGATHPTRTMPATVFNGIKAHIESMGLKVVFLGNSKNGGVEGQQYAFFANDYDYSGGLNLINKTGLLEAAKIIDGSQFIVGLDNGLLHLGAMTSAPIVFGYTIAGPTQRRPVRRSSAPIIDVTVSKDELACIHCQERIRFFSGFDFRNCFYGDFKCLPLLSEEKFISGIEAAIAGGSVG